MPTAKPLVLVRTALIAVCCALVLRPTAAAGQTRTLSDLLISRIGSRVRIWSGQRSDVPMDGRIQFVHDTIVTMLTLDDKRFTVVNSRSINRVAVIERQDERVSPIVTASGMLLGAAIAASQSRYSGPDRKLALVGRVRLATIGALLGGPIAFYTGEHVIPEERWVTIFRRE